MHFSGRNESFYLFLVFFLFLCKDSISVSTVDSLSSTISDRDDVDAGKTNWNQQVREKHCTLC